MSNDVSPMQIGIILLILSQICMAISVIAGAVSRKRERESAQQSVSEKK